MTNNILVDSSFLVSLFDETDIFHGRAKELHIEYKHQQLRPIILDCVVNETISVVTRRLLQKKRSHLLQERLSTVSATISLMGIQHTSVLLTAHFKQIVEKIIFSNGVLSFTDALIVFFLQENNITRLLIFDSDFDSIPTLQRISFVEQLRK